VKNTGQNLFNIVGFEVTKTTNVEKSIQVVAGYLVPFMKITEQNNTKITLSGIVKEQRTIKVNGVTQSTAIQEGVEMSIAKGIGVLLEVQATVTVKTDFKEVER